MTITITGAEAAERTQKVVPIYLSWLRDNALELLEPLWIADADPVRIHVELCAVLRSLFAAPHRTANPAAMASYCRDYFFIEHAFLVIGRRHPNALIRQQAHEIHRLLANQALMCLVVESTRLKLHGKVVNADQFARAFGKSCDVMWAAIKDNVTEGPDLATNEAQVAIYHVRKLIIDSVHQYRFDIAINASGPAELPAEYRSKCITKRQAAKLLGQPNEDSGVKWLNACIDDGTITCIPLSRQRYIFDIRQFPAKAHRSLVDS